MPPKAGGDPRSPSSVPKWDKFFVRVFKNKKLVCWASMEDAETDRPPVRVVDGHGPRVVEPGRSVRFQVDVARRVADVGSPQRRLLVREAHGPERPARGPRQAPPQQKMAHARRP